MSHHGTELRSISIEGFPEPVFDFERDLTPTAERVDGPVGSFKAANKKILRVQALETGIIAGNFQDCSPFSDSQQKAIRQEVVVIKGISEIFSDTLSDTPGMLSPESQAMRFYAGRVVNEAVVVEAARRAFLSEQGQVSDSVEFCKQNIKRSAEVLYPPISRELALDCLGLFHERIQGLKEEPAAQQLTEDFLRQYAFMDEAANRRPVALNEQVQAELQEYLKERFAQPFEQLQEEFEEISNDNLVDVTQRLLDLLGFTARGWKAVDAREDRVGFFVNPITKEIEVGERTKKITWGAFEQLMVHEVGVHASRSENALDAGQKALARGWLGYESPEEGLTTLFEKVWSGKASRSDVIDRDHYRYVIASFAAGALDGQLHDIQDTFDFSIKLNMISRLSSQAKKDEPIDLHEAEQKARAQMFEHVFRTFRGMPEGCVMTKDVVYFDGFCRMVKHFNNTSSATKDAAKFLRGKYNPFDPLHAKTVEALYGQQ